ncbi:alpha/beta hydrolase [Zafaria cholistanensis]|uniref:alpha/beta hydrolase n=1 Tax=Zafaria cholistanensis TaxID=1682741 RepID=UPI0012314FA1|nr:alpha/beta hydrolase [Zafaria cholistanensis]
MALDQATLAFLQAGAEAAGPDALPMWRMSPAEARTAAAAMNTAFGSGPAMGSTEEHTLTGWDGGTFRIRVHVPLPAPHSVFIYLHGGGWVLGDLEGYDTLARQLADKSGAAVVLVEYRKAPEHPFPAAVEDAWTALQWAAAHATRLAGADAPLFVGGDSAGGNLAAVMALRSRERGGPALARQFLIYPVTDADFSRASYAEPQNQTLLTAELMQWFWDHYLPDAQHRTAPEASPLRAADLAGLAPAFVVTAEHDVLRDEGEDYAERLRRAGNEVEFHRWPGQMHGFFSRVNLLPASAEVMDLVAGAVHDDVADALDARFAVLRVDA